AYKQLILEMFKF
ncbi:hypothetical protein BV011_00648B, partial [Haemophilus influenzae]